MRSDFFGARQCLERAFDLLQGSDRLSEEAREAISLLIEVMATKEYSRADNTAIAFPQTSFLRPLISIGCDHDAADQWLRLGHLIHRAVLGRLVGPPADQPRAVPEPAAADDGQRSTRVARLDSARSARCEPEVGAEGRSGVARSICHLWS